MLHLTRCSGVLSVQLGRQFSSSTRSRCRAFTVSEANLLGTRGNLSVGTRGGLTAITQQQRRRDAAFSTSAKIPPWNTSTEGWFDSHAEGSGDRDAPADRRGPSSRAALKDTPVNKSILSYIETIGVGIPPKRTRKRRPRKKRRAFDDGVLDDYDEREYFNRQRQVRSAPRTPSQGRSKTNEVEEGQPHRPSSWWLPPPPFASNDPLAAKSLSDEDRTGQGHRIIRLPVKVLGSAGSLNDEFPRSSKGLPEVALAGRSNVGKSTLLNALLYGNQPGTDGDPLQYRLGRRRNPEATKMPKGAKAVVSEKPGETREITLYQLSSKICLSGGDNDKEKKVKMSLVLSDLPGYGFAFASEEKSETWRDLMQHYLLERGKSLKRVLLLVDARHGLKGADFKFLDTLQDALWRNAEASKAGKSEKRLKYNLPPIQIILTKCDLVTQHDLAKRVVLVREQLSDSLRREPSSLPVMLVSAKAGIGYNNVRQEKARGGVLELQRELAALVPNTAKAKQN